jgi:hypothetical protein
MKTRQEFINGGLRLYVLRRKICESDQDKYEYLINSTSNGVNITTPFINKATRYSQFNDVFVHGQGWEFIRIKK